MNIEELRDYCLAKKGISEGFPFDDKTLVFKVMGKMFALTSIEGPFRINLKCDPEKAIGLRAEYPAVTPGYHMSKVHWNTVEMDGSVSDDLVREWVDDSYNLIAASLKKADREALKNL